MTHIPLAILLFALALFAPPAAAAQEPGAPAGATIADVDVSGIERTRLSPGLRADLSALKGTPLDHDRLNGLAARIESEHPEMVAAVRTVTLADNVAQVIFFVGRISDDRDLAANINARYVVEIAEIRGIRAAAIDSELRAALDRMEGRTLDPDEAEQLEAQVAAAFPDYDVDRRIRRAAERGRIRLVFDLTRRESSRWIPFAPSRSKIVFHEAQDWTGALDIPIRTRDQRFTFGVVWGNADDLVEEYSGFRVRLESVSLGTERLGLSLELARFESSWEDETLNALAANPALARAYDHRLTIEPALTFAPWRQVRVSAGVSVSDLEPLESAPLDAGSRTASAFVGALALDREWRHEGGGGQRVAASYAARIAEGLGGDFEYRRHQATARYAYAQRGSEVIASMSLGHISGRAPLFERFTLGDSSTLRGWNKYDLAPAGGDRLQHYSVEYRLHGVAVFLDAGSVWGAGEERELRYATGFGFHSDRAFFTVGFPLNAGEVDAAVMLGVRF